MHRLVDHQISRPSEARLVFKDPSATGGRATRGSWPPSLAPATWWCPQGPGPARHPRVLRATDYLAARSAPRHPSDIFTLCPDRCILPHLYDICRSCKVQAPRALCLPHHVARFFFGAGCSHAFRYFFKLGSNNWVPSTR